MDLLYYVFALTAIAFVFYVRSIQFAQRKLPPGPFTFPFGLGIIPSLLYYEISRGRLSGMKMWDFLDAMSTIHGDIFSVEVGGFYAVVITSYELLQEVANMDEYSVKFSHESLTHPRTFQKELGLVFVGNNELWTEMRKFTQRTLRDFGFGKRLTMQSAIEAETTVLIEKLNQVVRDSGGVIRIRTFFILSVLNVLWCMVSGQRYEHDDQALVNMMERNFAVIKSTSFTEPFNLAFPLLKKLCPPIFKEDLRQQVFDECHQFTKDLINHRKKLGNYKTSPENYVDAFLQKVDNGNSQIYTEEQLQAMLQDLLQTGSMTTNGTLNYALLYLILYPDVQEKCQAEIDAIVSKHLAPTLEDIQKMHYFQAFLHETHRLANIVPNPVPRIVPHDWNLRGYKIPKGSVILSNHYSVHMSERYWKDPTKFDPERFIDENGEFVPDKRVIHFGFGKRKCIGITLANSVIPLFLASLLQRFSFSVVPGTEPPSVEPEPGVSLSPMEFPVCVKNRFIH